MEIKNSKILVIGGAGFIGSFVVAELLKEDVAEIVVYDNFARGKKEYLEESLKDKRCRIYPIGGDIRETDILNKAMEGMDHVICLAAMWLLHCKDFPRTASMKIKRGELVEDLGKSLSREDVVRL